MPIEVEAKFADGRSVRAVTVIVDQNPTPVAAQFDIGGKRERLKLSTLLRLNAGTACTPSSRLPTASSTWPTASSSPPRSQAACSAPPSGNPEETAATLGKMSLEPVGQQGAATQIDPPARLKVMHLNHTGMVLDQLTLLYVPLRLVTDVDVRQGEDACSP